LIPGPSYVVTDLKLPARSRNFLKFHLACLAPLGTVQFCAGLCTNTGTLTPANFFVGGVHHPPPMIFFVMSFHYFVKAVFRKEHSVTNSLFFLKNSPKNDFFSFAKIHHYCLHYERVLENFFFQITVKFD
jgi:hypothetical protein